MIYTESIQMLMDFQKFLLECPDELIDDPVKAGLQNLREELETLSSPKETKNALAILKWFQQYPDFFEVFKWVTKDLANKPPNNSKDSTTSILIKKIIELIETRTQTTEPT